MNRLRVFACSIVLLAATLPTGAATPRAIAAPADCGYDGYFNANTLISGGGYTWDGDLSITAEYIPAKDKLTFTVIASFSGGASCSATSFSGATGTIGLTRF
jgi:hypothetical protein